MEGENQAGGFFGVRSGAGRGAGSWLFGISSSYLADFEDEPAFSALSSSNFPIFEDELSLLAISSSPEAFFEDELSPVISSGGEAGVEKSVYSIIDCPYVDGLLINGRRRNPPGFEDAVDGLPLNGSRGEGAAGVSGVESCGEFQGGLIILYLNGIAKNP